MVHDSPTSATRNAATPSRRLQILAGLLVVLTVLPAVVGFRIISGYAAIPRIVATPEREIVYQKPGEPTLSNNAGVLVGPDGTVYLAETASGRGRLIAFPDGTSDSGVVLAPRFGEDLHQAYALAQGPDRTIYLLDSLTGMVYVYGPVGGLLRLMPLGHEGALAIAVDEAGNIFVGDSGASEVLKYLPDGTPDAGWGAQETPGARTLGRVVGLAAVNGDVYAAVDIGRIVRLDRRGTVVFDRSPLGNVGPLNVGPHRTLIMSELRGGRVFALDTEGRPIGRVVDAAGKEAIFLRPMGVAVSGEGSYLYVANWDKVTVHRVRWPGDGG